MVAINLCMVSSFDVDELNLLEAAISEQRYRERVGADTLYETIGCADEASKIDVNDPTYLDAIDFVNNICSWLRHYLFRFFGIKKTSRWSRLN